MTESNNDFSQYRQELLAIKNSLSYKLGRAITFPFRLIYDFFIPYEKRSTKIPVKNIPVNITERTRRSIDVFKPKKRKKKPYEIWIEKNYPTLDLLNEYKKEQATFAYKPKISIVIPVYNVDEIWLEKAIQSIKGQIYSNWEVCITDDCSTYQYIAPYLKKIATTDKRFKVSFHKKNGRISRATNTAIKQSTGDYIVFMDNDDELANTALFEIAKALNEDNSIDVLYSDEDKINTEGKRFNPFFKPNWSPELLLSYNYLNHLLCVRKSLLDKIGYLRPEMDGCQDYDLILRLISETSKIKHLPRILYHWRALETSIAGKGDAKSDSLSFFDKGIHVLENAMKSQGYLYDEVKRPEFAIERNLGLFEIKWPKLDTLISIYIEIKSSSKLVVASLESIFQQNYENIEVVLYSRTQIDTLIKKIAINRFKQVHFFESLGKDKKRTEIINSISTYGNGELFLFLDDDLVAENDIWLQQLVGIHQIAGVGISGSKILQSDGKVLSAGIIQEMYPGKFDDMPYMAYMNASNKNLGYFFQPHVNRNVSAISINCFLVKKELFESLGKFDFENYDEILIGEDFCNRSKLKSGVRTVLVGSSVIKKQKNDSFFEDRNIKDLSVFKHKNYKECYYNPNLSNTSFNGLASIGEMTNFKENKPCNILFVTHNLNLEGAPIQLLEVVEGLLTKGYQISILSPYNGPLKDEFHTLGVEVHIMENNWFNEYSTIEEFNKNNSNLSTWLENLKVDLIFANTLLTYEIIRAASTATIPSIWWIHESYTIDDFFSYKKPMFRNLIKDTLLLPNAKIFVAKTTKDLFKDYDFTNSDIVINNALKLNKFLSVDRSLKSTYKKQLNIKYNKKIYLNLGTICERKGQIDFVKAGIKLIKSGYEDALFYLVGGREDDYLLNLKKIIQENNVEKFFHIIMETRDVVKYYLIADIFVCTSYIESYPRTILEAMYFNLPIISTKVFGISEQIIEGVNGEFFPKGNINELKKKMISLYSDNGKLIKYAQNSGFLYEVIISYPNMINKYQEVIEFIRLSSYSKNNDQLDLEKGKKYDYMEQ